MDDSRILKAKGRFNLRVQVALKPLEMYGQKPFVDYALNVIKMLNEIAIYEVIEAQPPAELVRNLQNWQSAAGDLVI